MNDDNILSAQNSSKRCVCVCEKKKNCCIIDSYSIQIQHQRSAWLRSFTLTFPIYFSFSIFSVVVVVVLSIYIYNILYKFL